jgi:catechol 2,3-dioxygenase-like lactoylglutathione lyase family enzyme
VFEWEIIEGEEGQLYVAVDRYHHRITIYKSDKPGLKAIGWQVFNKKAFLGTAKLLEQAGVPYEMGTPEQCEERKVHQFLAFNDPAGNRVEVCYAPYVTRPNVSSIGYLNVINFLHATLLIPRHLFDKTLAFYEDVLLFNVTDLVNDNVAFTRCSTSHHNLAIVGLDDVTETKLQHFMFEVESLDDVMKAFYRAQAQGQNIKGPGRHSNCKTVHVYSTIPGMEEITHIEIGYGHLQIPNDDQWEIIRYSLSEADWKTEVVNPWTKI